MTFAEYQNMINDEHKADFEVDLADAVRSVIAAYAAEGCTYSQDDVDKIIKGIFAEEDR